MLKLHLDIKFISVDDIINTQDYIKVNLKDKKSDHNMVEFYNNNLNLYILQNNYKKKLDYEYLGGNISKEIKNYGENFAINLSDFHIDEAAFIINGFYLSTYTLDLFKTENTKIKKIKKVEFFVNNKVDVENFFFTKLKKISDGNLFARRLCYLPPNILTPKVMMEEIKALFSEEKNVSIEVLNKEEIKNRNMNLLYGVGMGSINDPYVVIIKKGENPNIALLGKGVTFDTGGISLKPSDSMIDMKKDMAGAASVIGAIYGSEEPVLGIVGLVENMIGSNAQRVSDVWTSMSGNTVEILNTDAEGRLVLADLMTLAQTYSSINTIIDLATLTGAVGIALGKEYAGLMSNSNSLTVALLESGKETGDLLWSLPCGEEYNHHLESKIADIKNVGTKGESGTIAGAKFIEFFIKNKNIKWAHIDMAYSINKITPLSYNTGTNGYGVRLLNNLLNKIITQNCCQTPQKCCPKDGK